jgi:hypothetical protein
VNQDGEDVVEEVCAECKGNDEDEMGESDFEAEIKWRKYGAREI